MPDQPANVSAAIDRAVASAVAIMNAQVAAINVRLDGMEKSYERFQDDLTRVPTQLDRAITNLKAVVDSRFEGECKALIQRIEKLREVTQEQFTSVASQFHERDKRNTQRAEDSKVAINESFTSVKEATTKIESGFTKSIDSIMELIRTTTKASDEKTSDLKDRLTAIEARTIGITSATLEHRAQRYEAHNRTIDMQGVVAIIISFVALVGTVLLHFVGKPMP